MGIVDHDQRLVLCAQRLHPSRRRPDAAQRCRDMLKTLVPGQQGTNHGKQVGGIEAAHHRRGKMHAAQIELDADGAHSQIFRAQDFIDGIVVSIKQRIAEGAHAALQLCRKVRPDRVVKIEHCGSKAGGEKQLFLGQGVGIHRAVIIQMIARQVGEYGDVEGGAVDPALVESDGRNLHRTGIGAPRDEAGERRMQGDGIRRGVGTFIQ